MQEADRPTVVGVAQVGQAAPPAASSSSNSSAPPVHPSEATACSNSSAMSAMPATLSLMSTRRGRVLGQVGQVGQRLRPRPRARSAVAGPGSSRSSTAQKASAAGHLQAARRRVRHGPAPADGMAGPDQPVRGRPDRARQQPRGPLADDGGRRAVGHLAFEEGQPLGEAIRPAERGGPVLLGQRPDGRRRRRVEASPVPLPPSRRWRRPAPGVPAPRPPSDRGWPGRAIRRGARWRRRPSGHRRGPRVVTAPVCPGPGRGARAGGRYDPAFDDRRSDGDDATAARHPDHRVLGPRAGSRSPRPWWTSGRR